MELKPGYKQTEVGMIPHSWGYLPIGYTSNKSRKRDNPNGWRKGLQEGPVGLFLGARTLAGVNFYFGRRSPYIDEETHSQFSDGRRGFQTRHDLCAS